MKKTQGFTLLELLISIAILGIVTAIAMPNLNEFFVKMRVDNEISKIHRIILLARNGAISTETPVTICPLSNNVCTNNWQNELTIFTDIDSDGNYEPSNPLGNEEILSIKDAISSDDKLQFPARNKITYEPTGRLSGLVNSTFKYCPKNNVKLSRGIVVYRSGRVYQTSDIDNDGKDETRSGTEITCS